MDAAEPSAEGITKTNRAWIYSWKNETGTPPRLDGRTINYEKTEEQYVDKNHVNFSYMSKTK